jgi:hypothetical protein
MVSPMPDKPTQPKDKKDFAGIVSFGESAEQAAQSLKGLGAAMVLFNTKALELAAENELREWCKANGLSDELASISSEPNIKFPPPEPSNIQRPKRRLTVERLLNG